MNLPDKCPFCGAGVSATGYGSKRSERWVSFDCFTQVFACDPRPTQSESCKSAERARLAARVAELEARCKRLEEAGDNMLEALYTPEPPRCMCHRSPPCDDCVNYALARDAKQKWQQAKEAKP